MEFFLRKTSAIVRLRNKVPILAFVVILWVVACDRRQDRIVAKIGKEAITLSEFEARYAKGKLPEEMAKLSIDEKKKYLDQMIEPRLKLAEAYALGLEREPDIAERCQFVEREGVYRALIDREVVAKIVSEKQIRDEYDRRNREARKEPQTDSPPLYEDEKSRIKAELTRQSETRKRLQEVFEDFARQVARQIHLQKNENGIQRFVQLMKARWQAEMNAEQEEGNYPPGDQFGLFADTDMAAILATWKKDTLTIGEVVKTIRESSPFTQPRLFDSTAVVNEMDKILRLQYLTDFAYQQGLAQNQDVVESVRRLRENLLLRRVQKKQVDEAVNATEDEIRAYYDTHRHLYNSPAQKKVREIQVSNLDRAFEIAKRAKAGENFQKLAHQYNERETTKRQDGLLGFISAGAYGAVGSTAAGMKIGEIGGPVELAGKYSVFQVLEPKEPQPLSYALGRDRAKRELLAEKKKAREAEWNKMLRDRYPVTVYDDVLQTAFQKMT